MDTGFARCDLLAVLAGIALTLLMILPSLATSQNGSDRLHCLNNLRQIGQAFHLWGKDHNNAIPWRTSTVNGGTMLPNRGTKAGNVWWEFNTVKSELSSPRILVCPSDNDKRQATTFDQNPTTGLLHQSFRNNAISYWINLDANTTGGGFTTGFEITPFHVLIGDRNIVTSGVTSCSSGVRNADRILNSLDPNNRVADTAWTPLLHNGKGNVLFSDGSALQLSTHALRHKMAQSDDNGSLHILKP